MNELKKYSKSNKYKWSFKIMGNKSHPLNVGFHNLSRIHGDGLIKNHIENSLNEVALVVIVQHYYHAQLGLC